MRQESRSLPTSGKVCCLPLLYWHYRTFLFNILSKFPLLQCFHKTFVFVGLVESASLWAAMPVEVRLPTSGSPQIPSKQDPHWEVLLVLLLVPCHSLQYISSIQ